MLRTTRRRAVSLMAGASAAAVLAMVSLAAPAGATVVPAANATLVASGSATTYNLMQGMDTLFSDSPGCNLIDNPGVTQALDFSCPQANNTTPPPNVSSTNPPYPDFATSPGYADNPANDTGFQEPPLGSSNGIFQLENQGTKTANTAPINYARSSRALKSSDFNGLNFVAYAVDGVTWFHYTEVNGHPTPSASVKNLTQALLEDAWNGTLQCWNDPVVAAGSGTPSLTYSSPGCQPIILYTAQAGSGTRATWDGYLGYPSTGNQSAGYILSINGKQIPNVQNKKGKTFTETFNSANHIILENEDRAIINNGDEANALFFFSWGKFQVECKVTPSHCGVVPNATGTTKAKLGQINGIPATQNNILCGAAVGGTNCGPTVDFAPTRFIYNVYSNGSDSAIPEATPNTLNYVSEVGFICKPHTVDGTQNGTPIVDPNTGVPYRTEVANVITQAGFIPMPFQASEGSVPHSATALLQAYASANPSNTLDAEFAQVDTVGQSPTAEHGYCLVTTTDNNNNP